MKWLWIAFSVVTLLLFSTTAFAQEVPSGDSPSAHPPSANPQKIREIEITTSSRMVVAGGVAVRHLPPERYLPQQTDLLIQRKGDTYFLGDTAIDASLVDALGKAMQAPPKPKLNLDDLRITAEWLKENVASVVRQASHVYFGGGVPVAPETLETTFTDVATINKLLPGLFDQRHYRCADCVRYFRRVEISIKFEDFSTLKVSSDSEFPFMLPWEIAGKPKHANANYNADISRAAAALMPEGAINRDRLAGATFAAMLGSDALLYTEREVRMQDIESKAGGALSVIRSKFTIESANFDSDREMTAFHRNAPDLHLHIRAAEWPPNFSEEVSLAYVDGKVVGVDNFLSDDPHFVALALSVPWLSQYLQRNPKTPVELKFVHEVSFGEEDRKAFSEDMQQIGRSEVLHKVEPAEDSLAVITLGRGMSRTEWLIFPDGYALLWRSWRMPGYADASLIPAWSAPEYSEQPCAAPRTGPKCVGREVSPSGNLVSVEQSHAH
jgi:hypothetical protein